MSSSKRSSCVVASKASSCLSAEREQYKRKTGTDPVFPSGFVPAFSVHFLRMGRVLELCLEIRGPFQRRATKPADPSFGSYARELARDPEYLDRQRCSRPGTQYHDRAQRRC